MGLAIRVERRRSDPGAPPSCVVALDGLRLGDGFGLALLSDLHVGSSGCDEASLRRDVRRIADEGRIAVLNGDVLDLLTPKDLKRFRPSTADRRVLDDDLIGRTVGLAADILAPIADRIAVVGCGNHEDAVLHRYGLDPAMLLVHELRRLGSPCVYQGWEGYVVIQASVGSVSASLRIRCHHGAGGEAPVTGNAIPLMRTAAWSEDADIVWLGHKHDALIRRSPCVTLDRAHNCVIRERWLVSTPGYQLRGPSGPPERGQGFAQRRNMAPSAVGCAWVDCRFSAPRRHGRNASPRILFSVSFG